MAELYDEDGNAVEAFTKEELDAELTKAKEESTTESSKKIEELEAKVKKLQEKDLNFEQLRKQKEAKDKENLSLEEQFTKFKEEQNERITRLSQDLTKEQMESKIINLAEGSQEVSEKIKFYFDQFALPKEGEEDTRLESAFKLATGKSKDDFNALSGIRTAGGEPPTEENKNRVELSPVGKDALEYLKKNANVTKEDLKKFGLS